MQNTIQRFISRVLGIENSPVAVPKSKDAPMFLPLSEQSAIGRMESASALTPYLPQYYQSWVYAAINARAEEVGKIELRLFRKKANGENEKVETHEALDLLHDVNNRITQYDLFLSTQTYKDIYGEAFWWLVRDGKGKPLSIFPWLNPANMDIETTETGDIKGYKYRVPGGREWIMFKPDDILHFKYFDPKNPYRGMSPITAARYAIATEKEAQAWNFNFFKNNARPGGIIIYPSRLDKDQIELIKAQWDGEHRGTDNAGKLAILSGGPTYSDVGVSQKDMDFLEQQKFNRDQILTIFRVPLALLNPDESINRATAEAAQSFFFERVIEPRMLQIVNVLNEFYLPAFDPKGELFFDFDNQGPRDLVSTTAYYTALFNIGAITQNEIRAEENLDRIDGGDTLFVPFNLQPAGIVPEKSRKPDGARFKHHTGTRRSLAQKIYPEAMKLAKLALQQKAKRGVMNKSRQAMVDKQKNLADSQVNKETRRRIGEGFAKVKRARVENEQKVFVTNLKKQFVRQEKQVLASLSTKAKKDITFDFDIDEEAGIFADVFKPIVADVVKVHGEDALRLLGDEGFDVNRAVTNYVKRDGLKFAKQINETTSEKINRQIASGIEEGEGIEEIRRRINMVFEEASTSRARMIAQTEVNKSSSFGIEEGFRQSEVVEEKEWFTPLDVDDEVCVPMDGVKVGLEEKFSLSTGEDVDTPPAHPNCHCTILPVIDTSKMATMIAPSEPVVIETHVIDEDATKELKATVEAAKKVVAEGHGEIGRLKSLHDRLESESEDDGKE